ncbi:MAG: molybdopterin biosynthesis protein [Candidatus Baltobacteraceae bacterium]
MSEGGSRTIFLEDVPLERARERFAAALAAAGLPPHGPSERIALAEALGRVSAAPVFARLSSPHYHACAMDGIALHSERTRGARETAPLELALGAEARYVDTGDPLPEGSDAVVPIEEVEVRGAGRVAIRAAVAPFSHVRAIGEDIVATEAVVTAGRTLEPADLAALAAAGLSALEVVRLPRVTIVTTGSELVAPDVERPAPGAIVDSNAVFLRAAVQRWGGLALLAGPLPDDPAQLEAAVRRALETSDVVVVNAGSSAGSEDFTAGVFARLGEVVVHGVAIRPGHPLVLAVARQGERAVPLLGIPGYPVSTAICADLFLRPLLERLGRRDAPEERTFEAVLARKLFSPLGEEEFVRGVAARVGERSIVVPLRRGAGVITSLSRANCLVTVPRLSEGFHEGTRLRVRALRPLAAIERTLLAVGSHDVALDLLAGGLAERGLELVSANVGSIAGLAAVAAAATHVAGTHAIDPATGTYNDAAVRRYVPGKRVALVHFARRTQGLIVASGNPLGLRSLADVAERRARFVNRQKDAGTRLLLDLLLGREGIAPGAIPGYERLEFTHLAVAALVAAGSADCGLGILAAARALGCDFVPLAEEPYELALDALQLADPRVAVLLEIVASAALRAQIAALGGYDPARSGTVRYVEPAPAAAPA